MQSDLNLRQHEKKKKKKEKENESLHSNLPNSTTPRLDITGFLYFRVHGKISRKDPLHCFLSFIVKISVLLEKLPKLTAYGLEKINYNLSGTIRHLCLPDENPKTQMTIGNDVMSFWRMEMSVNRT